MNEYKRQLIDAVDAMKDISVFQFVRTVLDVADEEFWLAPSSSSGKYHPPEDQGESGLVRHTVKAIAVFKEEARRRVFEDYEFDAGLAAVILHDIKKNGQVWEKQTDYRHGIIGAKFLEKFMLADTLMKKMIMDAVRYHMSPWNTTISRRRFEEVAGQYRGFTKQELEAECAEKIRGQNPNRIEKAVQDADYWASRNDMSFFPGVNVNLRDRHDAPTESL
jgi:hypothetical protein